MSRQLFYSALSAITIIWELNLSSGIELSWELCKQHVLGTAEFEVLHLL